jgi:hypothetical protein
VKQLPRRKENWKFFWTADEDSLGSYCQGFHPIGRPLFWGLAFNGEDGVVRVLDILREEMEITMAKCGRPTIGSIDSTVMVRAPQL